MARRIFAAIEVPEAVRYQIVEYCETLRSFDPERSVRWERADKLHLTLKFVAEASDQNICDLQGALEHVAAVSEQFDAEVSGTGVFPNERRANVLWLGIGSGAAKIADIAAEIEAAAQSKGIPGEARRFKAHLTIGRVRDARRAAPVVEKHLGSQLPAITFSVDRLVLIESHLSRAGSRYELLSSHSLQATSLRGISLLPR